MQPVFKLLKRENSKNNKKYDKKTNFSKGNLISIIAFGCAKTYPFQDSNNSP